jgi:hypothetical protein
MSLECLEQKTKESYFAKKQRKAILEFAFSLWDCEFDSRCEFMTLVRKESVNALPKVLGFLQVLQFPLTGNVDRVGWDKR